MVRTDILDRKPPESGGDIRGQVVLPFRKALQISFESLQVRFLRNCVTVTTLILAVAFLGFTLVSADIATGILRSNVPGSRQMLVRAGFDLAAGAMNVGATAKDRWIIILSLLVCAVGIVNAQLMSVTERFREIGTMKCLGALDSFILRLFLIEAALQGLAGALLGGLLGTLTALLVGLVRFGPSAVAHTSPMDALLSLLAAAGVGLLLSMLGVLYPAVVAARMQPVEAMRAEE
ncbi:protein of unknown function DUF214 [Desulfovibrio sp. X2]|uniref:ABC transporter permease n=1 Tax=Desulfovibrio sp. X2 TaxID=941449 RepID=UPI000358B620|nr:FtsX-like permease family protein [Desulfovibrio sp. X2]EPR44127.1 protein of unknown function DUF214 [Desulfovibrio sp. X2]